MYFIATKRLLMKQIQLTRLAIADDHWTIRKGIASILSETPTLSLDISAKNGKELIALLNEAALLPDIVILDINMPVLNGYETMATIKKEWPQLKVLAFSMYNDAYPVINMLRLGACGFLSKDSSAEDLIIAIEHIKHHGFYYSKELNFALPIGRLDISNYVPELSDRERSFLSYCCEDLSYKEIATAMQTNPRTIEYLRETLFKKLKVNTRVGLAVFAIQAGLLSNTHICSSST